MKRKLPLFAAVVITAALTFTGCAGNSPEPTPSESSSWGEKNTKTTNKTSKHNPRLVDTFEQELPNGEKVFCIYGSHSSSTGGGLWCTPDYENAE
jgi:hypothetical protein